MSFFDWNGDNIKNFIGFNNFIQLFQDDVFWQSIKNMGIYVVTGVIIQVSAPLAAAVLVFHITRKKLQGFLKTAFILPLIVPHIVIYLMWSWIYRGHLGLLNEVLKSVGLDSWTHAWLGEKGTAIWSVIFVNFPWVSGLIGIVSGVSFLIYLAGLMSIPRDLFEVAKIDGMGACRRFFSVEFPLIRSQVKLILILTLISQIQVFENILVMTEGGPGRSTTSPALYMYEQAFTFDKFGYASAIGIIIFVVLLIITLINQMFIKNTEKID